MHIFYTPDINYSHQNFVLTEEESKHAIRVLRLVVGVQVSLVNGYGDLFTAEIIDGHPKRTTLRVLGVKRAYQKPSYNLHIAIAPTKNMDRLEWFVEKATEIGVQEITPILSEHSERKDVKKERLTKVAIAAMKQSLKAYLPKVNDVMNFSAFIQNHDSQDDRLQKAIAHCVDAEKKYVSDVFIPDQNYLILIGPEGDFSSSEIQLALSAGFYPISLGDARLRTETAALAATVEVSLLNR